MSLSNSPLMFVGKPLCVYFEHVQFATCAYSSTYVSVQCKLQCKKCTCSYVYAYIFLYLSIDVSVKI